MTFFIHLNLGSPMTISGLKEVSLPKNVKNFMTPVQTVKKTVLICDTQPVSAEGLRTLIEGCSDLAHAGSVDSLAEASELVRTLRPSLIVIDKSFGIQLVMEWVLKMRAEAASVTEVVVWGVSVTEAEALRFLQAGAKGILRKTSDVATVIACI